MSRRRSNCIFRIRPSKLIPHFRKVPELIWNEQIPTITNCFQSTIFTGVPCVYLLIFAPYEVLKIKPYSNKPAPWTLLNISKIVSGSTTLSI